MKNYSNHKLGPKMSAAARIYGLLYLAAVTFLHSQITEVFFISFGKFGNIVSKLALAYITLLGIALAAWPNHFYKATSSPFWIALVLASGYLLVVFVIPMLFSLILAFFELSVLIRVNW